MAIINNLENLREYAKVFLTENPEKIFAFYGNMGVGKTTFIKELCLELGVSDTVSSPTFSIVNEYITSDGEKIFHFDFYRINNLEELFDIGIEEYFSQDCYIFMEWPEKIEKILPENSKKIYLYEKENGQREISTIVF